MKVRDMILKHILEICVFIERSVIIKDMAKTKEPKKVEEMVIGDFILVNSDKVERVINGVVGQGGRLTGGLGKGASPELIIAHYDKNGGLIRTKDGQKVATGSFWDFENRKPRTEPEITFAQLPNPTGKIQVRVVQTKGRTKKQKEVDGE